MLHFCFRVHDVVDSLVESVRVIVVVVGVLDHKRISHFVSWSDNSCLTVSTISYKLHLQVVDLRVVSDLFDWKTFMRYQHYHFQVTDISVVVQVG